MDPLLWQLLIFCALLVLSAFFSGSETAMLAVNTVRLDQQVEKGNAAAKRIRRLLDNPKLLISVILVGNNLINVGTASLATLIVTGIMTRSGAIQPGDSGGELVVIVTTLTTTVFLLIFGEITPKGIALQHADKLAPWLGGPLAVCTFVFGPIARAFNVVGKLVDFLTGVKKSSDAVDITAADILTMARRGIEGGVLKPDQADLIRRVVHFGGRRVRDIMMARVDVVSVAHDVGFRDLRAFVQEERFSRYPVVEGSQDNVRGIFNVLDLFAIDPFDEAAVAGFDVTTLSRPAIFVPNSALVDVVFRQMQREKSHMAIVVDEYGGMAGVVTLEDILEEITGEILDEHDNVEPDAVRQVNERNWVAHGHARMTEVVERVGVDRSVLGLDIETLGGYVMHLAGSVPNEGDTFDEGGFSFNVRKMHEQRVKRVHITRHRNPSYVALTLPTDVASALNPDGD